MAEFLSYKFCRHFTKQILPTKMVVVEFRLRRATQNIGKYNSHNCFCGTFYKTITAQKMKFSIKDFFSKCDQIRTSFFCAVDQ